MISQARTYRLPWYLVPGIIQTMGWLSLLPPVLAILIAVWKREVILALLVAILAAETLLNNFNPFIGFLAAIGRISYVFSDAGNARILLFSLLIAPFWP